MAKVSVAKVSVAEVSVAKVAVAEVRNDIWGILAAPIPDFTPLNQ